MLFRALTLLSVFFLVGLAQAVALGATAMPESPEELLASQDSGQRDPPPGLIQRYGRLLDSLQSRCTESRVRIASMAVVARRELETRYSRKRLVLRILTEASAGLEGADLRGVHCQDALAAVIVRIGEESEKPTP